MKNAAIAFAAAAVAATAHIAPASASASYHEISQAVDVAAFDSADAKWRRLMVNTTPNCGAYGSGSTRRIDVIIERYEELAQAIRANNEAAAMDAGARFASVVNTNDRFTDCWNKIARRVGAPLRLPSMF